MLCLLLWWCCSPALLPPSPPGGCSNEIHQCLRVHRRGLTAGTWLGSVLWRGPALTQPFYGNPSTSQSPQERSGGWNVPICSLKWTLSHYNSFSAWRLFYWNPSMSQSPQEMSDGGDVAVIFLWRGLSLISHSDSFSPSALIKSFNASPQESTDGWDVATFCSLKRTLSHSNSFLAVLLKFLNFLESTGEDWWLGHGYNLFSEGDSHPLHLLPSESSEERIDGSNAAAICLLKGTLTHSNSIAQQTLRPFTLAKINSPNFPSWTQDAAFTPSCPTRWTWATLASAPE